MDIEGKFGFGFGDIVFGTGSHGVLVRRSGGAGFWLWVSDCEGEFGGWGAFVGAGSLGRFGFVVSVSVGKG